MISRKTTILLIVSIILVSCSNKVEDYYENGALKSISETRNGQMHGAQIIYYKNGVIREKRNWNYGILTDSVFIFDTSGLLSRQGIFDNGHLLLKNSTGDTILSGYLSGRGLDGYVSNYYKNGILKSLVRYEEGQKNGIHMNFFNSGSIKSISYFNYNKLNGSYSEYFESGKLKLSCVMKDDYLYGNVRKYYKSGLLKSKGNIYHDKKQGKHLKFDSSGTIISVKNYSNGRLLEE